MKKATRNYIVFVIMLLLGLFQAVSGFVLWLVFPRGEGYRGGRGLEVVTHDTFLWPKDAWFNLHDWVAVAMIVMVVIHLALHWRWITYMTKAVFKSKS